MRKDCLTHWREITCSLFLTLFCQSLYQGNSPGSELRDEPMANSHLSLLASQITDELRDELLGVIYQLLEVKLRSRFHLFVIFLFETINILSHF